ncbi:HD domain-containing protein [Thermophagus xiamenensis]|uniref:HD domain-containing protein n=1 Tax=Thermophagus xiamenensis TaxID=385682 RepID=A0A1I1X2V1_9BACT|nr:HD domain-containing protein [Thermophagus xiamenensis]SFE01774.1 uncharacterized protein SAMN05444380_105121 [Thermophagus xiamenensis]
MDSRDVVAQTAEYVKTTLQGAEGGHDWWHTLRVWKMACRIAKEESADVPVVELAALLHDIADSKFYDGDEEVGPRKAVAFLRQLKVSEDTVKHVEMIIRNVSFKGGNEASSFHSKELDIVRDADRLDAMGAIGIARTFNYGGYRNRELYNPGVKPNLNMTREEYKKSTAPTINHFYEKLLRLKERMQTNTGRALAEHRHRFMEQFLDEFFKEWDGKL